MRYKELRQNIPDISQKMLTISLKRLEENHLINRQMFPEIPPRVEYSLTETGNSFMPAIQIMIEWAEQHFTEVIK